MVELAAKAIRAHNLTKEHQSDTWFCTQPAAMMPGGVASVKNLSPKGPSYSQ